MTPPQIATTIAATWNAQTPHETAKDAARLFQWSVIPIELDKRPSKTGGLKKDGTPYRLAWTKYQSERAHEKQIDHWHEQFNSPAWAIITGAISNVVVLDFDGKPGRETLELLGISPHLKTGSGGNHVYFQHPGWHVPTLNSKSKQEMGRRWPGLDIRADGGYAAFCGHNDSGPYEWLRDFQPESLDILPDDLRIFLGLMYSPDEAQARNEPAPLRTQANTRDFGNILLKWALSRLNFRGRNDGGFDLALQLRDNGFPQHEARSIILEYAQRVPATNIKGQIEAYTDEEALNSLANAYKESARQPWKSTLTPHEPIQHSAHTSNGNGSSNGNHEPEPPVAAEDPYRCGLTDLGNAERFADRYRDIVRWCETWNSWVVFNGKCWEPDRSGRVDQLAKIVVRAIYYEAAAAKAAGLTEDGEKIWKHAKASESNRAIRALLDRAKSELPITPDKFNTHLYLLNCLNGTLDLRTGELSDHNPHDFLTRCIKLKYNPLAPRPTWVTFVETILSGNLDLIAFMQEALGMSLSGDTSEQCLFICHGNGSNGKTTMLETIRIIMAGYGLAANIETFQVRKSETVRNDIAELYGARLVTASENTMGSRLNEAFIKKATGKEPLRARRLHENEFEFMPEFTLWLAVNHKPVVKDTTKGMWRRVHFIPFLKTFDEGQVDKHFGEKLLDEAEGILTWLVQGCMAWYSRGQLTIPKAVKDATQAYRAEMDMVGNFLQLECDLTNKKIPTKTKDLLERYEAWCNQLGETFSPKDLKRGLNEQGYHSQRGTGGNYVYIGIRLRTTDESTPPPPTSEGNSEDSEGSEPKNRVTSRDGDTPEIIQDLPSLTFTTFTNSSSETKLGKCEICKWRDAESLWKAGKAYCKECKEQERKKAVQS